MAPSSSGLPDLSPPWPEIAASIEKDERLFGDLETLCGFGGRFAGSDSERKAVAWLRDTLERDLGVAPRPIRLPYDGWQRRNQRLTRLSSDPMELACHALVWSPSTPSGGLEAEVVDLGRGTPDDIAARADELRGRIALVRHEYMFSTETVHRRMKYDAARSAGAVGFLIASHIPGEALVTGSSGRNGPDDIPGAAITREGGEALAARNGANARVRLEIESATEPSTAESLALDLPGKTPELVVLSAHIDGHPLGESAMDNATGLAGVLSIGRALAPHIAEMARGLRICLFTLEEWALAGSADYLDRMDETERQTLRFNVNLDSIAGDARLTALTSDFPAIEGFARPIAERLGTELGFHLPLMRNSDHYHFARHGIPAMRLVAGFNDPESNLRFVLTPHDRVDLIDRDDLATATTLAAAIVYEACRASSLDLGRNGA